MTISDAVIAGGTGVLFGIWIGWRWLVCKCLCHGGGCVQCHEDHHHP